MALVVSLLFLGSILSFPIVKRFGARGFLPGSALLLISAVWLLTKISQIKQFGYVKETYSWIPEIGLNLSFYADPLRLSFATLTLVAGAIILFYSGWYFDKKDESRARFSSLFISFAAAMLGLVLADNLYLFFVFWEATTVLSFLLIGHKYKIRASRSASIQALVVTTFGGLAMLVGIVLLHISTGQTLISTLFRFDLEVSGLAIVAIFLVLLGALTKSAIFPFHFWLPDAMAAPTPVSAYLHAAAMVKAGILLVIYLTPAAASFPGYTVTLVILGAITMLWGGYRSLNQYDLKLMMAHSTVSQLGMLMMLLAIPHDAVRQAGLLLTFAHAVSKAPLFLIVGIIDHHFGTRDIRELSMVGRRYPLLAIAGVGAAGSLAGLMPLIGFLAKESALNSLLSYSGSSTIVMFTLIAFIVGSALTAAYMTRFVLGSFSKKNDVPPTPTSRKSSSLLLVAPLTFVSIALAAGFLSTFLEPWAAAMSGSTETTLKLGLWHGFSVELQITLAVLIVGILLGMLSLRLKSIRSQRFENISFSHGYWRLTHTFDLVAVRVTAIAQRGSLPWYLGIILAVVIATQVLTETAFELPQMTFLQHPAEVPIAILIVLASIRAAQSTTRFKSVVLVGVTGYALVALFVMLGAPDLAITQALVETMTLITFILVIRKLPIKIVSNMKIVPKLVRIIISIAAAVIIGALAAVSLAARQAPKISDAFAELAYKFGHGLNIVNVTLVDIRAWDTMGELSVVVAAATGVASLIFIVSRGDNLPKMSRKDARSRVQKQLMRVLDPEDETRKSEWLLAGNTLQPQRRSIILEVVVRLIFHALMLLSIYLLLVGHNAPGGGFAGGLVAGLALSARYLAGGRHELGATTVIDAGRLLGVGLLLATVTALTPLFFGEAALTSRWLEINLGFLGQLDLGTSTIFDIGVYAVVVGLALDVLRSLGAQIDENEENRLEEQPEVQSR
ncbi:MAG TPA: Na+/H+ antiporter subunit A [Microbacteriaceae bacterium]|nr:Na+/H+ antiporter subunit A [Microbacteriaceae bacterium]